jgi:hypothetical protein
VQLKADIATDSAEHGAFRYHNSFFQFVGDTVHGKPTGPGVLYLADGSMMEGEFVNGEMTCENGSRTWPDGSTYRGPFVRGEAHGTGRQLSVNGDEYNGMFQAGMRHGTGVLRNRAMQTTYEGEFAKNFFSGRGFLRLRGGYECRGDFAGGKPHGQVSIKHVNGDRFDGAMIAGAAEGVATFHSVFTGIAYRGPMAEGRRAEVPTGIDIGDLFLDGSATLPAPPSKKKYPTKRKPGDDELPRYKAQLAAGDGFFTVPLRASFDVVICLGHTHRHIQHDGKAKRSSFKVKMTSTVSPQTSESGRRITATAFAMPSKAEDGNGEPIPLAHEGVTADEIQWALNAPSRRPSAGAPVAGGETPTLPALTVPGSRRQSMSTSMSMTRSPSHRSPSHKRQSLAQQRLSRAGSLRSLLAQQFERDIDLPPHDMAVVQPTVDGATKFHINLVTNMPGDYMIRFAVEDDESVQMGPGDDGEVVDMAPLMISLPVHVVRMC